MERRSSQREAEGSSQPLETLTRSVQKLNHPCLASGGTSGRSESSSPSVPRARPCRQKLDTLQLHMQEMHTRCDDVQSKLEQANSGTKYLLERAEGLRNQRSAHALAHARRKCPPQMSLVLTTWRQPLLRRTSTRLRSTLIELFLSRFTLAQAELETLTSREVSVGLPLFAAMDRVNEIRRDCRALLGGEEGGTTAGSVHNPAAHSSTLDG